jgi:hypothetical protein
LDYEVGAETPKSLIISTIKLVIVQQNYSLYG